MCTKACVCCILQAQHLTKRHYKTTYSLIICCSNWVHHASPCKCIRLIVMQLLLLLLLLLLLYFEQVQGFFQILKSCIEIYDKTNVININRKVFGVWWCWCYKWTRQLLCCEFDEEECSSTNMATQCNATQLDKCDRVKVKLFNGLKHFIRISLSFCQWGFFAHFPVFFICYHHHFLLLDIFFS